MKFSIKQGVAAGFTALALAWGTQAQAATVNLAYVGPAFGTSFVTANVHVNNASATRVAAGAFNMTASGAGVAEFGLTSPLLAWCVEITQTLRTASTPYATSWASNQSWHGNAQTLISVAYDAVLTTRNNVMSAAFQLALWELVTGSPDFSLSAGDSTGFRAAPVSSSNSSAQAVSQAQTWLSQVNSGPARRSDYYIVLFQSDNSQDLISLVPTPLPGAALLFASALGLGAAARRARARKSAAAAA